MKLFFYRGVLVLCFATLSMAQLLDSYGKIGDHDPPKATKPVAKNAVTLAELGTLDQQFHKELDAAQDLSDAEKFAEAGKGYQQVVDEVEALLKRIAVSSFNKNATLEILGVTKPATVQTETDWFNLVGDRAKQGVTESGILEKVGTLQKQGADLIQTGKYPDDVEAYKKSVAVLTENKAQFRDTSFKFYMKRAEDGQARAITSYWQAEYARLRDQYNKSTEPNLPPEQVRKIIQGVVDEISSKGYLDAAKHPDMPGDARGLFKTLVDAGNGYLSQ